MGCSFCVRCIMIVLSVSMGGMARGSFLGALRTLFFGHGITRQDVDLIF
jgi:hypothetical protein